MAHTCRALFNTSGGAAAPVRWPPPRFDQLSPWLQQQFTLHEKIPVFSRHLKARLNGGATIVWDEASLARDIAAARNGACIDRGYTGDVGHCTALRTYPCKGRGVVIGSQDPWLEANILAARTVEHVTTIEYSPTECRSSLAPDPSGSAMAASACQQTRILHPDRASEMYLAGELPPFDFAWSYSSNEHSGLGRYGDPISPWADLEALQRVWCLLKPNGILFLAVPTNFGADALVYNAHRVYGPLRLPLLIANFELVDVMPQSHPGSFPNTTRHVPRAKSGGTDVEVREQPVLVLRKKGLRRHGALDH